jgi:hypothetical protein
MQFTFHVISDTFFYSTENSQIDENIPDVDVVFINGNIGNSNERSLLYITALCKKYPATQFVYNPGFLEIYTPGHIPKILGESRDIIQMTQKLNKDWPTNLHYSYGESKIIRLRNNFSLNVMCLFGFPQIIKTYIDWKQTIWFKNIIADITADYNDSRFHKPTETSNVPHGTCPIWATIEWVNQKHEEEWNKARTWEVSKCEHMKVLCTHLNPIKDKRYEGQLVQPYNIHLQNGLWTSGGDRFEANYVGAKFISNPGRGSEIRSKVFVMD